MTDYFRTGKGNEVANFINVEGKLSEFCCGAYELGNFRPSWRFDIEDDTKINLLYKELFRKVRKKVVTKYSRRQVYFHAILPEDLDGLEQPYCMNNGVSFYDFAIVNGFELVHTFINEKTGNLVGMFAKEL